MPTSYTFVLIPGLWHGAWSWLPVSRRLHDAGHDAVALTMPGMDGTASPQTGPDDAVNFVVDQIERRDLQRVVLVGHSWGGYIVTAAARQLAERVSARIYVNAFVPLDGGPAYDLNPEACDALLTRPDLCSDGMLRFGLAEVQHMLLPDATPELQTFVSELLVPAPTSFLTSPVTDAYERGLDIPAAYVLSEDDNVLIRPGVEMAERLGVQPIMAGRGHASPLTYPDEIATAVLDAVALLLDGTALPRATAPTSA